MAPSVGAGESRDDRARERNVALQNSVELDRFLAGVERRAFRIALFGLRNPDDALDVVQDAMMQLARKYSDKPSAEWTPLFYRILNNRIRDFQRHGTVRARVLALLPGGRGPSGEDGADVSQYAEDLGSAGPQRQSMLDDSMAALEDAVGALPPRQREAFLLRTLEGLNVRDTAAAMSCSEGSVKTHYFRAVGALREALGEHWSAED
ncbi:MAG: RNA polymerase sigma factor [Pseudomonadota bacterium]